MSKKYEKTIKKMVNIFNEYYPMLDKEKQTLKEELNKLCIKLVNSWEHN